MADKEPVDKRVYEGVAFASRQYIPWWLGSLRLGKKVNFDRVKRGSAKVLLGHDGKEPIGRIRNAKFDREGEVWRSDWEIPEIAANADTLERIDNKLLNDVSVGAAFRWQNLQLDNEDEIEDLDDAKFTVEDWELIEESLTPIPADTSVGMDRVEPAFLTREDGVGLKVLLDGNGAIMSAKQQAELRPIMERMIQEHNARVRREAAMPEDTLTIDYDKLGESVARAVEQRGAPKLSQETQAKLDELLAGNTERDTKIEGLISEQEKRDAAIEQLKTEAADAEKRAAEYRQKLDSLQFGGSPVLTMENWKVTERSLNLGNIARLSAKGNGALELSAPMESTLEESWLEQHDKELREDKHPAPPNAIARIPWSAIRERNTQEMVKRATVGNAAGVRPLDISVLGDAGLILANYAPIMARMDVRFGVNGGQKVPYLSTQPAPAPIDEGAAIPPQNYILTNTELTPKTVAVGFEITSALNSVDDGTFMSIINQTIFNLLNGAVTKEIFLGAGGVQRMEGLWSVTGVPEVQYGAAAANFSRDDILDLANNVRLGDTDGGMETFVLSTGLYKLCEKEPYAGEGATVTSRFMLEMGMMEGDPAFHYSALAPTGTNVNPGMYFKGDRIVVFFWGSSLTLQMVPVMAAKEQYKMCAEVNYGVVQPSKNVSKIRQTP